jgi:hypothetical protein
MELVDGVADESARVALVQPVLGSDGEFRVGDELRVRLVIHDAIVADNAGDVTND